MTYYYKRNLVQEYIKKYFKKREIKELMNDLNKEYETDNVCKYCKRKYEG